MDGGRSIEVNVEEGWVWERRNFIVAGGGGAVDRVT